jgi:hypothetical protein
MFCVDTSDIFRTKTKNSYLITVVFRIILASVVVVRRRYVVACALQWMR